MVEARNEPSAGWTDLAALSEAAEALKALAHPHRLRIVEMLLVGEYTVGELADACGIASHLASEHLRRMKDRGLLTARREGRRHYYRVSNAGLDPIMDCIRAQFDAKAAKRNV